MSLNSDLRKRRTLEKQRWNRRSFDSNLTSFVHPAVAATPEVQKLRAPPQYLTQNNFFQNSHYQQHFSSAGNIQPTITELNSNLSRSMNSQNQDLGHVQSILKQSLSSPQVAVHERKKIKIKKIKIPKLKDNKMLNDLLKDIK